MASIGKNGKSKRLWLYHTKPKKQIGLGQLTARQEREILRIVEPLEEAAKLGIEATQEQLRAVDKLSPKLREKLRDVGLLNGLNARLTIGEFGREWVDGRKDIQAERRQHYHTTIKMLEEYFGADKVLNDFSVGEAKAFQADLAQKVSANTVAGRIKMAKCLFGAAVDFGHIFSNPFAKVKSTLQPNDDRFFYIPKETIDAIIEDVTCPEWKAIITLWRYAGLRAQEPLHLTWDCVDWDNRKLTVIEPKNKRVRVIPLWPEVEAVLSVLFHKAKVGESRIITKYKIGQELGTQFSRIIKRAGFEVWPKPVQNLRASCQNDLEEAGYRMTAICSWIGNSKPVAQKHHLKTTEADFEKALGSKVDLQIDQYGTEHVSTENETSQLNLKNTGMLADASVCNPTKIEDKSAGDSYITAKTSVNVESAEKARSSTRSSAANLDQLAAILSSLAPEELAELLARVQKN